MSEIDILQSVFNQDLFNIKIDKEGNFNISSKDGQLCLKIGFYDKEIIIYKLEKCNTNGTLLLNLVEKFAEKFAEKFPKFRFLSLIDDSKIITKCIDDDDYPLMIDLAPLKILTKGMSWYNSLGFLSTNYDEEVQQNEKILQMPFKDTMLMASNIKYIKTDSKMILDDAHQLFPDIDIQMETGKYVNKILESINFRFDNSDELSCEKFKFIKNLLAIMSHILDYDYQLYKRIGNPKTGGYYREKKSKSKKNIKIRKYKKSRKVKHHQKK